MTELGNPGLGWEETTSFNGGFESAWFDDRVSLDLSFYFSNTVDQLFQRQIPVETGFTSILASMGQVDNRGIEVDLQTINIDQNDFSWRSNLTYWQNRNILVELYGDGKDDIANNLFLDESLGSIYGYKFDGIVQEGDTEYMDMTGAQPGDARFKDLNGDGQLTPEDDRTILGNSKPNFKLNLSNTLTYKGFTAYIQLAGTFGGNNYFMQSNTGEYLIASSRHGDNRVDHPWWTPENQSNTYPHVNYSDSRFLGLESRTYVKIQDLVLSYQFDGSWVESMNINNLKIYSGIQNLYTFTNWSENGNRDPEAGISSMSGAYPVPTVYTFGLDFSF